MQAKPQAGPRTGTAKQAEDADFLVEEFDLTEEQAADLVVRDGAAADEIKDQVQKKQADRDPLADVPSPQSPERDLTADSDEVRLKPVLHAKNRRNGAG